MMSEEVEVVLILTGFEVLREGTSWLFERKSEEVVRKEGASSWWWFERRKSSEEVAVVLLILTAGSVRTLGNRRGDRYEVKSTGVEVVLSTVVGSLCEGTSWWTGWIEGVAEEEAGKEFLSSSIAVGRSGGGGTASLSLSSRRVDDVPEQTVMTLGRCLRVKETLLFAVGSVYSGDSTAGRVASLLCNRGGSACSAFLVCCR
mmetsp:Transcript_13533/g.22228  ORF Transcript_13533/g.22228 Transcript_13533/m.22228 type:complete len:202 (-) Transcript_13533:632-1237(-)